MTESALNIKSGEVPFQTAGVRSKALVVPVGSSTVKKKGVSVDPVPLLEIRSVFYFGRN